MRYDAAGAVLFYFSKVIWTSDEENSVVFVGNICHGIRRIVCVYTDRLGKREKRHY